MLQQEVTLTIEVGLILQQISQMIETYLLLYYPYYNAFINDWNNFSNRIVMPHAKAVRFHAVTISADNFNVTAGDSFYNEV